ARATPPIRTRPQVVHTGPRAGATTRMKMNDPPQIAASAPRRAASMAFMVACMFPPLQSALGTNAIVALPRLRHLRRPPGFLRQAPVSWAEPGAYARAKRRQAAGGTPNSRLKALLNAASDS